MPERRSKVADVHALIKHAEQLQHAVERELEDMDELATRLRAKVPMVDQLQRRVRSALSIAADHKASSK